LRELNVTVIETDRTKTKVQFSINKSSTKIGGSIQMLKAKIGGLIRKSKIDLGLEKKKDNHHPHQREEGIRKVESH
jgi:hypothetical protein